MCPLIASSRAAPVALIGLAVSCGSAPLLFSTGAAPKVPATAAPITDKNATVFALAVADAPQAPVTAGKSDRLPIASRSSPPSAEPEALKPAEALDYAQAEAEQARRAHAEALDLCRRHGMHKHYFSVGRRQSWKCER